MIISRTGQRLQPGTPCRQSAGEAQAGRGRQWIWSRWTLRLSWPDPSRAFELERRPRLALRCTRTNGLRRAHCSETRSPRLLPSCSCCAGARVVGGDRAGRVALLHPASIVALSSAKRTRCVFAQNRGCPRNCRRRAFLDGPLEDTPGRSRRALSREPGDLPATHLVPALGWRAYGE